MSEHDRLLASFVAFPRRRSLRGARGEARSRGDASTDAPWTTASGRGGRRARWGGNGATGGARTLARGARDRARGAPAPSRLDRSFFVPIHRTDGGSGSTERERRAPRAKTRDAARSRARKTRAGGGKDATRRDGMGDVRRTRESDARRDSDRAIARRSVVVKPRPEARREIRRSPRKKWLTYSLSKKRRRLSRASSRRGTAVAAAVRAVEAMTVPGSEIDHLLFGASSPPVPPASRAPTPGTSPSRSPVVVVSSSDFITRHVRAFSSLRASLIFLLLLLFVVVVVVRPPSSDLDGTLYAIENGYELACRERLFEFMVERLGLPSKDAARELWRPHFATHNQSLKALRAAGFVVDSDEYWAYTRGDASTHLGANDDAIAFFESLMTRRGEEEEEEEEEGGGGGRGGSRRRRTAEKDAADQELARAHELPRETRRGGVGRAPAVRVLRSRLRRRAHGRRPRQAADRGAFCCTLVPVRPRSRGERRSLRTFSPDQPTRRSTARPPITHQSRRATSPSTVVHVFFHPRRLDSPIRSRRVVVVRIPQPAKTPPGEDPIPPKEGDVGLVCRMVDAYHDNKEERLYVTSQVVGRFRVDRVVTDGNPFFVAETSRARSYSHWSPYELVRVVNADP